MAGGKLKNYFSSRPSSRKQKRSNPHLKYEAVMPFFILLPLILFGGMCLVAANAGQKSPSKDGIG
jgi:hypothetical protein